MDNNEQNNSNVIIVIFILIIIIVGLVVYIIYNNSQNNRNNQNNSSAITDNKTSANNQNGNKTSTDITSWNDYILNCDITGVKLKRVKIAMTEGEKDFEKEISLTKSDLKDILNKLNELSIVKRYSIGMGIADGDTLTIDYNSDGGNYSLSIPNGIIFTETLKDAKLKELLEDSVTATEDEQYKGQDGSFFVYEFNGEYSTIYDPYFE